MSQVDAFLADMLPRREVAVRQLCAGEPALWEALWSPRDPVTLFGALRSESGWDGVRGALRRVASRFSGLHGDEEFELVAADVHGDLAYTVGLEHKTAVFDGASATYTLRVTHVFRREDGEWRIVHRHADRPPEHAVA